MLIFLVAIVVAVILSGTLPSLPMFQDAAGNVLGITIYKSVKLTFPAIIEVAIILLAALLSFKTTNEKIRTQNHFTWGGNQRSCGIIYRHFHHNAASTCITENNGTKPRNYRAI